MAARVFRLSAALIVCLLVTACGGDSPSEPPLPDGPLVIASGDGVSDTILTRLPQPLVVVVRTPDGAPRAGVAVHFEALEPEDPTRLAERAIVVAPPSTELFAGSTSQVTDSRGRASVLVQLGTVSGPTGIVATTPDGLTVTARYTVLPGAPVRLTVPIHDTTIFASETFALGAATRDRFGNARPEPPPVNVVSLTPSTPITVSADGTVRAGSAFGRARIDLQGAGTTDSVFVSVVPTGTIAATMTDGTGMVIVRLNGTERRVLSKLYDLFARVVAPAWAPDGSRIVFQSSTNTDQHRLYVTDPSGNFARLLPMSSAATERAGRFSRDGQWIYFSRVISSGSTSSGIELLRVHPDGTNLQLLTTSTGSAPWWQDPDPAPDGRMTAVNGFDVPSQGWRAGRFDLASGAVTQFPGVTMKPVYSPAGDAIAMQGVEGRPMVAAADGSNIRQLVTTGRYDERISWSADGRWLVARNATLGRLVVIEVSSGLVIPLSSGRDLREPAWRP